MSVRLYVGNLAYTTTDSDLEAAFAEFGQVAGATIPMDRATGRSRGFGFVEFANDGEAQSAIDGMNGADLGGRTLTVNVARERAAGGGGGNRGGGGRREGGSRGEGGGGFRGRR